MKPGLILQMVKSTKILALIHVYELWNFMKCSRITQHGSPYKPNSIKFGKKAYMLSLWRLTSRVGWLLLIIYLFVCLFLQSRSVMFSCTAVGSILRWLSYGKKLAELFSMRSKWGFPHSSTHLEIKLYAANWRRLPLKPTVSSDGRYSLEIHITVHPVWCITANNNWIRSRWEHSSLKCFYEQYYRCKCISCCTCLCGVCLGSYIYTCVVR